jgi:hypothetical protein
VVLKSFPECCSFFSRPIKIGDVVNRSSFSARSERFSERSSDLIRLEGQKDFGQGSAALVALHRLLVTVSIILAVERSTVPVRILVARSSLERGQPPVHPRDPVQTDRLRLSIKF